MAKSGERPLVGVSVLIVQNDNLLLGKRLGSHGAGTWSAPGGHLEFGETWEQCANREVFEETGMVLNKCYFLSATNDLHEEGLHYVTLFLRATSISGTPRNLEPEKCEGWDWFPLRNLPSPLFLPMHNLFNREWAPQ